MTGIELAGRLLKDIEASLALRARIPYLDMLKDLVEGGATLTSAVLNTSSNFGSFDTYLSEILVLLNAEDGLIVSHQTLPLPLSVVLANLTANTSAISKIFQEEIDGKKASKEFGYRLELVNAASV